MRLSTLLAVLPLAASPAWATITYWENHVERSSYEILSGDTVVLRGNNQVSGQLKIAEGGTLTVDNARDTFLQVGNLDVSGSFVIGSATTPYAKNATIELLCLAQSALTLTDLRRKGIVVRTNGIFSVFGAKGSQNSWTRLADTAMAGSTCLNIDLPSDWSIGDEIVIPSTDFDPHQTETRTIVGVSSECVIIDKPLVYSHFGLVVNGVDERAEIGLLSRNIVFRGCHEPTAELNDVGGHLAFLANFQRVQVQGVELQNFGQGDKIGRYPMHFHLVAQAPSNTFLRHNTIRSSNMRAITLHGTQGVTLAGNVAFNITGHAIFLEDGAETGNTITDNLVVLVKTKTTGARIGSDSSEGLSGFWLTNADNIVTGNVAVAVEGAGFWLHTRLGVKGESAATGKYENVQPYRSPMTEMRNNSAHSSSAGFRIESPQFDTQDSPQQVYSPPYTYNPDNLPVIQHFRVHHCRQGGWFRIFELQLDNWVVGDVTEGVQMLTQGNTATNDVATYITNSLFVGGTANRGNLVTSDWQFVNYLEGRSDSAVNRASDMRSGIKLYDGPLYLTNCTFTHWYSQSCLNYINPAIGAREYNTFVMPTNSFARDLVFIETSYSMHIVDRLGDGGKTTSFVDTSGSISNVPGATILPDWEFYATTHCDRNVKFGLACPHKYSNFDVVAVGSSDDPSKHGKLSLFRNNVESEAVKAFSSLNFTGQYIPASNGWLYHPILSPGAVYTLLFENEVPDHLKIVMSDTEHGQVFTLMICYPAETTITSVKSATGANFTQMTSAQDAQCVDCYLYDSQHHVLLIRIREDGARVGLASACPVAGCSGVDIVAEIPISDGVNDAFAYVLNDLQVYDTSSTSWTAMKLTHRESGASSLALNQDWCSLDDPCLNAIDEGNRKIGVLAYHDSPCNGIGCFSPTCRYCKLSASKASAPFLPCPYEDSVASTQGQAAGSVDDCSEFITAAEIALHVQVTTDASCEASGVGCITDECRYCRTALSPAYVPYPDCSVFSLTPALTPTPTPTSTLSSTPSPTPPPNATPYTTTFSSPTTTTPTTTPTSTLSSTPSSSPSPTPPPNATPYTTAFSSPTATTPTPTQASTNVNDYQNDACSLVVPSGDKAVGISAMLDTTCSSGGIGCFNAQCRFCKMWTTIQSQNFNQCPRVATSTLATSTSALVADACWTTVSLGDLAVGMAAVTDSNCTAGGLGCYSSTCRFCKLHDSSQANAYLSCNSVNATALSAILNAPLLTPTPTPSPTFRQDTICADLVTSGDKMTGVSALGDTSCASGGLGCFSTKCRYCQTRSTAQSQHLNNCTDVVKTRTSSGLESAQEQVEFGEACMNIVDKTEKDSGVLAFTDATCTQGECFGPKNSCRRCKLASSTVKDGVPSCPAYVRNLLLMDQQQSSTTDPTSLECTFELSLQTLGLGLAAHADASCPPENGVYTAVDTGCSARKRCRLCSYSLVSQSSGLTSCPSDGATPIPTEVAQEKSMPTTLIETSLELAAPTVEPVATATTTSGFSTAPVAWGASLVVALAVAAAVLVALVAVRAVQRRNARVQEARDRLEITPSIMVIDQSQGF